MASVDRTIAVGRITRPHGRRGELRVWPYRPLPSRIREVCFVREGTYKKGEVSAVREHQGYVLLKIAGITSRQEAEALRDCEVYVARDLLDPLPDNTFHVDDLIGCSVVSVEGCQLGTVEDFLPTGGVDLLLVGKGDHQWMLPAARRILVDVSLDERRLTVSLPEGLLDLNC